MWVKEERVVHLTGSNVHRRTKANRRVGLEWWRKGRQGRKGERNKWKERTPGKGEEEGIVSLLVCRVLA